MEVKNKKELDNSLTKVANDKNNTEAKKASVYSTLAKIDVKPYIQKKMQLNYLSWAKAWGLVKAVYPDASYTYTEYDEYLPSQNGWVPTGRTVDYRLTPVGCEVEVTVTIDGVDTKEHLYVMDARNRAVKNPDYGQINKAQKRCLVKALANAGLGLGVYAGEDLPSDESETVQKVSKIPNTKEELEKLKLSYNDKTVALAEIYDQAIRGSGNARRWWNKKLNEPQTYLGQLVIQADKVFKQQ